MLAISYIAATAAHADHFKLNKKAILKEPLAKEGIEGQFDGISTKRCSTKRKTTWGSSPRASQNGKKALSDLGN